MKTDGVFGTSVFNIKGALNKPFHVVFFGDVHRESPMHADTHWGAFLKHAKKMPKYTYFFGMGDFADGCSTSERAAMRDIHDSTKATLENIYKGVVKTLANELSFMRGRVLGMLGGDHFYEMSTGETTDVVLAHALGAKYLGCTGLVRISVELTNGSCMSLDIFANHGRGGGRTPGGQFNAVEDMLKVADADIYAQGHTHAKGVLPSHPRMKLVSGKNGVSVRERTPWLARTGSFLKAYENGKKSYTCDALYPANALGWVEFEVTPRLSSGEQRHLYFDIRGTA